MLYSILALDYNFRNKYGGKVLVEQLFGEFKLEPGERFSFNSEDNIIRYVPEKMGSPLGNLSLLHEVAHARLGHYAYNYDLELFQMELEAWEETERLAKLYGVECDLEHIEECIKSYDHWLTKRATCPKCGTFSFQLSNSVFSCFHCDAKWRVNTRKDRRVKREILVS